MPGFRLGAQQKLQVWGIHVGRSMSNSPLGGACSIVTHAISAVSKHYWLDLCSRLWPAPHDTGWNNGSMQAIWDNRSMQAMDCALPASCNAPDYRIQQTPTCRVCITRCRVNTCKQCITTTTQVCTLMSDPDTGQLRQVYVCAATRTAAPADAAHAQASPA